MVELRALMGRLEIKDCNLGKGLVVGLIIGNTKVYIMS